MALSAHTRKRQFQPSIDSFFHRSENAESSATSRSISPMSPPLPADTQASLLSVGMRVRKSVPEGYKTHKTLGEPGFPFPSTAPTSSAPPRPAYSSESSRELAPFCGLHKVGGWAPQFSPPPSSAPAAFQSRDEVMPALSMSQSTIPSTQSSFLSQQQTPIKTNKRSYEDEIEDELDAYFSGVEDEDHETLIAKRVIAQPKNRMQKAPAGSRQVAIVGEDGDFEEAAFLAPMEVDT